MEVEKEALNLISMQVILHAGNARELIFTAVNKAAEMKIAEADQLMVAANKEIVQAHKAQTNMLQKEADGITIPYSPLFCHGQDTLMTVISEMNVMKEIIKLYKRIEGK